MSTDNGFLIHPGAEDVTRDDVSPDVLAIDFDDELKAREALLAATRLGKRRSVEMTDAAIVTKTPTGKTRIMQTRDISPSQGATMGAWWGGLFGLLAAGMVGWLAGIVFGAVLGGLWARSRDIGISDSWMKSFGDRLLPGHAAAFFQMPHVYATHLIRELRRFDGSLLHNSLRDVETSEVEAALAVIP